jgi:transcriptional regulator with XRE-family HTH domain
MAKRVIPRFKRPRRRTFFRQWRKFRGYTLEQAAELTGMSIGNISAMERGAQGYTQDGLEALAEAYNCTPGQLLTVDPQSSDIWSIWERAKEGDQRKIVEIAKTIVGLTGTSN